MRPCRFHKVVCLIAFATIALLHGAAAFGQATQEGGPAAPATQPSGIEVREWAVFVLDAPDNQLNPDGAGMSPLPGFIESHRHPTNAEQGNIPNIAVAPASIGFIRIYGSADSKVDVCISGVGGKFLASYPRGDSGPAQVIWRDITLADRIDNPAAQPEAGGWFADLRKAPSDVLLLPGQPPERFLLYDVAIPYSCPLKVKSTGPFSFDLTNTSRSPMHDLMLLESDNGHWRMAKVGDVAIGNSKSHHIAPASRPAAAIAPATQPDSISATLQLTSSTAPHPNDLTDAWRPALRKAGIADTDCDVIAKFIGGIAGGTPLMMAIYRLDDAELDRLLSLQVIPRPVKISRVALVIIRNCDPSMNQQIDALINQLGDADWPTREAASTALARIGAPARPRLKEALKSKDPEVIWRAERLLDALAPHPPAPRQPMDDIDGQ